MIEANNPEINVDILMQKVQEELAKRPDNDLPNSSKYKNVYISTVNPNTSYINALLKNAESRAYERTKWPDKFIKLPLHLTIFIQKIALKVFNFIFKDQREVNLNLISAFKEYQIINQNLTTQVETLRLQLEEYTTATNTSDKYLEETNKHLNVIGQRIAVVDNWMTDVDKQLDAIKTIEKQLDTVETIEKQLDTVATIEKQLDIVDEMKKQLNQIDNKVQGLEQSLSTVYEKLNTQEIKSLPDVLEVTEESYISSAIALSKIPIEQHEQHEKKDLFYYLFENVFYNSEVVKEKQKKYIEFIPFNLCTSYRFLDAGCGRGEFILNLVEKNIKCVGIDINKLEIDTLIKNGLDVYYSDILDYLEKNEEKYCGISALQVVEHLNIEYIHNFLRLSFEKLVVNGVIIIETVNPHSLYGLSNFYQDSTHIKPLPPELLKFLLEWHGFKSVKIIYSSLIPHSSRVLNEDRMNYQDYAVVAYKKL